MQGIVKVSSLSHALLAKAWGNIKIATNPTFKIFCQIDSTFSVPLHAGSFQSESAGAAGDLLVWTIMKKGTTLPQCHAASYHSTCSPDFRSLFLGEAPLLRWSVLRSFNARWGQEPGQEKQDLILTHYAWIQTQATGPPVCACSSTKESALCL